MKKRMKLFCVSGLLLLTACGTNGVKLEVDPLMPVPVLVVPDNGEDAPNNQPPPNNSNTQYNRYPNNPPPEYTPPVQPKQTPRKNRRSKKQRNDSYNQPPRHDENEPRYPSL